MGAEYESLDSETSLRKFLVRFVGGTAAVTKILGRGITVTYISTGIVDLTWNASEGSPGRFMGLSGAPAFQANTASAVKGYTCVPGAWNATTRTLRLNITSASEALVDLAALQFLNLTVVFSADSAN